MSPTIEPVVMDAATDWSGQILPRRMVQYLFPGCVVRVVIKNNTTECSEAIYFELTKIKDGTFWGTAYDTYRMQNCVDLATGDQMTFRKEHINEIPLDWQPKRFQKAVVGLTAQIKDYGHFPTGVRFVD